MSLKFSELNLEPRLQTAVEKLNYQDCTPIQAAVIPIVQAGKDVSGLAQTGTGKTAAFLIPLMDRILKGQITDWAPPNFVLILVPTRELAEQVYENVQKLSEFTGLKGVSVYGGTGYDKQKDAFRNNVEFVVATPGRLIDLYKDHVVDLKQVRAIVFDEADRMFDMGFKDDMKYILQRVPRERQFLVFSATLNFDVLNTAYQFGAEPIEIDVSRDQAKAENVKDEIFHCGHHDKPAYLISLIKKYNPRQVIIFSNFKLNVEKISNFLSSNGIPGMGISSLLTQSQRNRVIELFKADNEKNILVATDVAARGLDIKGVDMVINYELPNDPESYVHRIGRTGRAGAEGRAFSLVCDRDVDSLGRIEDYLKHKLETGWIEDAEIIKEFKAFPREDYGNRSFERSSEGGDRPRRDSRGGGNPRREGGGGRGGDRDRGPRQDRGERRPDRPPRQERPHVNVGNDPKHPDLRLKPELREIAQPAPPRADGKPHPDHRRPRHQNSRGPHRGAKGETSHGGAKSETSHSGNGSRPASHQRPQHDHRRPAAKSAAAKPTAKAKPTGKSTVSKVTGFLKKIFG